MLKFILFTVFTVLGSMAFGDYPNGTLLFSSSKSLVGRIARNMTGGDQYTHTAIVIDNYVYEADWPRVKRTHVNSYGKRGSTNDFYIPKIEFTQDEVNKMRAKATSLIGTPYRLRNYFRPNSRPVNGTWCSPFTGIVLNSSGRYRISQREMFEPQDLFHKTQIDYNFKTQIRK